MYGGKLVYQWQLADAEPSPQAPIITRCALHAHTLEIKHPTTGQPLKFEAPLPADMQNLLNMLRKYRKT
jgi:23S rRNA-/tRNA-specific pseudouridylate synthase